MEQFIDEKTRLGPRGVARMNLTLNAYTQWYWKTDLLDLQLNFFLSFKSR